MADAVIEEAWLTELKAHQASIYQAESKALYDQLGQEGPSIEASTEFLASLQRLKELHDKEVNRLIQQEIRARKWSRGEAEPDRELIEEQAAIWQYTMRQTMKERARTNSSESPASTPSANVSSRPAVPPRPQNKPSPPVSQGIYNPHPYEPFPLSPELSSETDEMSSEEEEESPTSSPALPRTHTVNFPPAPSPASWPNSRRANATLPKRPPENVRFTGPFTGEATSSTSSHNSGQASVSPPHPSPPTRSNSAPVNTTYTPPYTQAPQDTASQNRTTYTTPLSTASSNSSSSSSNSSTGFQSTTGSSFTSTSSSYPPKFTPFARAAPQATSRFAKTPSPPPPPTSGTQSTPQRAPTNESPVDRLVREHQEREKAENERRANGAEWQRDRTSTSPRDRDSTASAKSSYSNLRANVSSSASNSGFSNAGQFASASANTNANTNSLPKMSASANGGAAFTSPPGAGVFSSASGAQSQTHARFSSASGTKPMGPSSGSTPPPSQPPSHPNGTNNLNNSTKSNSIPKPSGSASGNPHSNSGWRATGAHATSGTSNFRSTSNGPTAYGGSQANSSQTSGSRSSSSSFNANSSSSRTTPGSGSSSSSSQQKKTPHYTDDDYARAQEEEAKFQARRMAASIAGAAGSDIKKKMKDAFEQYENQWKALASFPAIRFDQIPWPILPTKPLTSPEQLGRLGIASFILSPHHSQNKSRKDRIKAELLRWHPDRFEGRYMSKVQEADKDKVKNGVGEVARCLSELLSSGDGFAD